MRTRTVNCDSTDGSLASYRVVLLVAALSFLAGCNRSEPVTALAQAVPAQRSAHTACDLLTNEEIQRSIGPHSSGRPNVSELTGNSVMTNMWGFQSCRWTATTAQPIQGFPNGWFDKIELKVFDADRSSSARKQAEGEPLKSFGEGARYDATNGRLWFNCGRDQYCVLNADTADSDKRPQLVRDLATLVQDRLK